LKGKMNYIKKFGDDQDKIYPLKYIDNQTLTPFIGVKEMVRTIEKTPPLKDEKGIIIGNIRMGFGHYRIAMAIASCAYAKGYTPYWFDLNSFKDTTGGKVIGHLNNLYSMGSRWSQKYFLFNKFYWEPLNSQGFRKLTYNAMDQRITELMTPIYKGLDPNMPFIATHVWPAQAAVHAGMTRVVNIIPDNWPMALHLAEGTRHTVQTPSSYFGYKTLNGMTKSSTLQPMPAGALFEVGHYIDHELLIHLKEDCASRLNRISKNKNKRLLLTIGGAGAQEDLFIKMIRHLMPKIQAEEVTLFINVGDHLKVWQSIEKALPEIKAYTRVYINEWEKVASFSEEALTQDISGIHAICDKDIFAAVYSTNLLMRASDILVTKPSELSFYPVPKLLIKRVGGHEAWGAIRAAEIGDGTIECPDTDKALQMLDLLLEDENMLKMMVNHILKAYDSGIYDGGYKAVDLAVESLDKWQLS